MRLDKICFTPSDNLPEGWQTKVISAREDLDHKPARILIDPAVDQSAREVLDKYPFLRVEELQGDVARDVLQAAYTDENDPVRGMLVRTKWHDEMRDNLDLLQDAHWLDVVVRAGIGVDELLARALLKEGIKIKNSKEANQDTVHRMTVKKMHELLNPTNVNRRVFNRMYRGLMQPGWKSQTRKFTPESVNESLKGKKVVIIGFGGIGSRVAKDCHDQGAEVIFVDSDANVQSQFAKKMSLQDALASDPDVISVHVNGEKMVLGYEEMNLINPERENDVVFLNTARGAVVDAVALCDMVESGRISGAYVDVLPHEEQAAFTNDITRRMLSLEPLLEVTQHMLGGRTDALQYNAIDAANKVVGGIRSGVVTSSFGGADFDLPDHLFDNGGPVHLLELINLDIAGVHRAVEARIKSTLNKEFPGLKINVSGHTTKESEYKVVVPDEFQTLTKPGASSQETRMAFHLSRWDMPEGVTEEVLRQAVRSCIIGDSKVPGLLKMRFREFYKV